MVSITILFILMKIKKFLLLEVLVILLKFIEMIFLNVFKLLIYKSGIEVIGIVQFKNQTIAFFTFEGDVQIWTQ